LSIINKINNVNLREGLKKWRLRNDLDNVAKDWNESGPVMDEVLEAKRLVLNLK
jgi:hypothetical protein